MLHCINAIHMLVRIQTLYLRAMFDVTSLFPYLARPHYFLVSSFTFLNNQCEAENQEVIKTFFKNIYYLHLC